MRQRVIWLVFLGLALGLWVTVDAVCGAEGAARRRDRAAGEGTSGANEGGRRARAEEAQPEEEAEAVSTEPAEEDTGQPAAGYTPENAQLLEDRLKALQKAAEKTSAASKGKIVRDIKELAKNLPKREKDLINPETGQPIVMNPEMAGRNENQIQKPEEFITFYADALTPDKGLAVIFADGTVKYLTQEEFDKAIIVRLQRASADDLSDRRDRRGGGKEH